ncbi:MAG: M23 family metallopeptidase [Anaerolineales bacterium]|nr:M23 family metallopeptidase [Anaerolineales bacterium]
MLNARKSSTPISIWEALTQFADRAINAATLRISRFEQWVDANFAPSVLAAQTDLLLILINHHLHHWAVVGEEQTALAFQETLTLTADWRTLPPHEWQARWQEYGQIEWLGLMEALQQVVDILPQWARTVWWDVKPAALKMWEARGGSALFWAAMSGNGLVGFVVLVVLAINSTGPVPAPWRGNYEFPLEARGVFGLGPAVSVAVLPTATPMPTTTPEPVLTATPIPMAPIPTPFPNWESTLPQYGGWNGGGQCWGPVAAPVGSGYFVWPTDHHVLVGRNYTYWHPGLDLGGNLGDPLYAADSGAVVYAGWNNYGYGNLVIIDHGNGWHTLYAHFNEIYVACGEAVTQGDVIGAAGTTGNSTGPHLHFEMRYNGGYVSPWNYLP